ncbi:uracil-DNA glycosylase [Weissella tructae]|uniref:Uracil-DNA glycosylase n=2 Tax=Weissella TaxID=46255 RepID=A0A075U4S0_9LACO|nr:Uracil-DNA glycosylase [Weissella tructae]AIM62455.1 Uracil-DNA glycosylase [Weissella ceti]AIM63792.1 Uracil-DNA glycosylase [Weissella ceti]ELA07875.1 uracil-DNA glycosylase [Weissella ceti NC36]
MQTENMQAWTQALAEKLPADYWQRVTIFMDEVYSEETIYPARENVFAALDTTALADTRVVILGQDPYINPGQAQGLSFSVPSDTTLPPSLRNIFKEIASDLDVVEPTDGDLHHWANQGVLLLNAVLTVPAGKSNAHAKLIWETLTDAIISVVAEQEQPVVFILWGAYAQKKAKLITGDQNLILKAPHPSPLSSYRGFFGSKPFSQTNAYLAEHGQEMIDWV